MRVSPVIGAVACLAGFIGLSAYASGQRGASSPQSGAGADATARIVTAAQAFLQTLDDPGRSRVQFRFNDSPQKARWSNLPSGSFKREGLQLRDLAPAQRAAAMTLLETALSRSGYQKVIGIMRDRDEYFLAFLGTPSVTAPWMLQFGGHHLAINLTLAGRLGTLAPSHTGTQPASYTIEGRTVRPLGEENDRAFELVASLDASQRSKAILDYRVSDLVLGRGRMGGRFSPRGSRRRPCRLPSRPC